VGCGGNPPDQRSSLDPEIVRLKPGGSAKWVQGWALPGVLAAGGDGADICRPFERHGDICSFARATWFSGRRAVHYGRLKDLISYANYYPQDIERTVQDSHPLRPDCAPRFGGGGGHEQLVSSRNGARKRRTWRRVRRSPRGGRRARMARRDRADPAGSVPKTSSGKIQRHACRRLFGGHVDAGGGWGARPTRRRGLWPRTR
jgi:acyl-CoA synthetase (AMP-forming)/AMP-acid ligase II